MAFVLAIGLVVDDAIVDVENVFRRLRENAALTKPHPKLQVIAKASGEVRNSIFYATILIILVFLPLLGLTGVEGKLFAPIAIATIISMIASFIVSLTAIPVLCSLLLNPAAGHAHKDSFITRSMKRLAARYGTRTLPPSVQRRPIRTLEEIVCENAAEGCVRETFGALVGLYQAGAARDPFIARAMSGIAADEVRHAALAWQVARWADRRLSPAARARVRAARVSAIATLRSEVESPVASELTTLAGLPPPAVARQLVEKLAESLWT